MACINIGRILSSIKADGIQIESDCLHGEYRELCELLGFEAVEKLYQKYYGGYLSLPKKFLADEFVHGYIVDCCKQGRKPKELARNCDYTYSWIMKLIRKHELSHNGRKEV